MDRLARTITSTGNTYLAELAQYAPPQSLILPSGRGWIRHNTFILSRCDIVQRTLEMAPRLV